MIPTPSRIVLYHFATYARHGSSELVLRSRPAIVTSAEGTTCNLHVFFEPQDFIGFQSDVATHQRVTSIVFHNTRLGVTFNSGATPLFNTWTWPPRV